MSLLDFNVTDVPDQTVLPQGQHQLEVARAEVRQQKPEKGQSEFLMLTLVPTEDPNAKEITHVLMLPDETVNERDNNNRARRLKEFIKAFGISAYTVADIKAAAANDSLVGASGFGVLAIESSEEYGEQNRVQRFLSA